MKFIDINNKNIVKGFFLGGHIICSYFFFSLAFLLSLKFIQGQISNKYNLKKWSLNEHLYVFYTP